MCTKRRFPDKISAEFMMMKIRRRTGRPLKAKYENRAYQCPKPECTSGWHLTSQQQSWEKND